MLDGEERERPCPACAITVPHAEPASPQSKPYTNSSSSTTLTTCAATRIRSGVAEVADAAQVALAGAREHERRRAERRDAQVRHRAVEHLALRAHQHRERLRRAPAIEHDQHRADDQRQPLRLRAEPRRLVPPRPAPCSRATCAVVP